VEIRPGAVVPWRQVLAVLRGRLADGTYAPGGRIPAIIDLAHEFGVANSTVRKALDVLKAEGALVTNQTGTYVALDAK
jgi:GntR family transcriptional regulator